MGVLLEINAGPFAGKKVAVVTGQTVTFGRAAERAQFPLPHDTFMSGVHFAVECGPGGCRVQDRKSSNGTFLNGARIADAMLANGDEIKGGQTIFAVKVVADAKLASILPPPVSQERPPASAPPPLSAEPAPPAPAEQRPRRAEPLPPPVQPPQRTAEPLASAAPPVAQKPIAERNAERPAAHNAGGARGFAFSVMGWSFPAAPAEWQVQEGFGLQQSGHEEFPSSVAASEELLGGITLQQFVESQISMLRRYLRDPKIEPALPPRVGGAEESMAMDVRHSTKDGRELVYRRIYARSGSSVGVLTVKTLAADLPQVLQSLQPLLDGAAFHSTVNN
jgi:FHA domain-containing protein